MIKTTQWDEKNKDIDDFIATYGSKIADLLLDWYHVVKRDLPWRRRQDPYGIWISEVMLQQTQVDTVIDYYNRFMEAFPSVTALADANEEKVLKLWEGLGYYSRARRLKQCAIVLMEKYKGEFPRHYNKVLQLPGIGPYTAGAILSIAYNMAVPAVDGNVMRVFARLFNDYRDINSPKTRKVFELMANKLLPKDCRHFNQSLMELGALICTPSKPKCNHCPLTTLCLSKKNNTQTELPIKQKKTKQLKLEMEVAFLHYKDYRLIVKRPSEGLLANLWGFPIIERSKTLEKGLTIKEELEEALGMDVHLKGFIKASKHVFSHRTWDMSIYAFEIDEMVKPDYPEVRWVKMEDFEAYPLPTAFKKLI